MRIAGVIMPWVLVGGRSMGAVAQVRTDLRVFEAADLAFAFLELAPRFERAYDSRATRIA